VNGAEHKPAIRAYRDLVAYQAALDACDKVYAFADRLPKREQYALSLQIRRAGYSVPLNIAEGFGTGTRPMFLRHLRIARGSITEVSAALDVAERLGMGVDPADTRAAVDRAARVLQGLITSLERSTRPPPGSNGPSDA